jgi:hypothetical protein
LQQIAKADLDGDDLHDLHGKHVWKRVEKDSRVGAKEINEEKGKPVPEGCKPSQAEDRAGRCEVSEPEASISMEKDKPVPEGWKL